MYPWLKISFSVIPSRCPRKVMGVELKFTDDEKLAPNYDENLYQFRICGIVHPRNPERKRPVEGSQK